MYKEEELNEINWDDVNKILSILRTGIGGGGKQDQCIKTTATFNHCTRWTELQDEDRVERSSAADRVRNKVEKLQKMCAWR